MNLTVVLMLLTQIEAADPRVAEFLASTDRQVEVLMTPDGEFDAVLAKADGGPAAFEHYSDRFGSSRVGGVLERFSNRKCAETIKAVGFGG